MSSQTQLVADLKASLAQMKKTAAEIVTVQTEVNTLKDKVTALETVVAAGEASPELVQAVADVKAQAQTVDDEIPDSPVQA